MSEKITEDTDFNWNNNKIRKWVSGAPLFISGGSGRENFFGDYSYLGRKYPENHQFRLVI